MEAPAEHEPAGVLDTGASAPAHTYDVMVATGSGRTAASVTLFVAREL